MQHEHVSFQGGGSSKDKTTNSTLQVDEVEVEELVQPQDVHVEADRGAILALHHCHQFWSSFCGSLKCVFGRYVAGQNVSEPLMTSTYKKVLIMIFFCLKKIIHSTFWISCLLKSVLMPDIIMEKSSMQAR